MVIIVIIRAGEGMEVEVTATIKKKKGVTVQDIRTTALLLLQGGSLKRKQRFNKSDSNPPLKPI